jgi:hypothetical protein
MDIKDVLLTDEEVAEAILKAKRGAIKEGKDSYEYYRIATLSERKAQCLKLLKVLEDEGIAQHLRYHKRKKCPLCELKKMLEG